MDSARRDQQWVLIEWPDEGIVLLTLNRPAQRDSVTARVATTLSKLGVDPRCRAVILTGAGPVFCAGADLGRAVDERPDDERSATRIRPSLADAVVDIVRAMRSSRAPS